MIAILVFLAVLLTSCTPSPVAQSPPKAPVNVVLPPSPVPEVTPPPPKQPLSIEKRLDKLQGQIEWMQQRIGDH
jgi:hypothetical protein